MRWLIPRLADFRKQQPDIDVRMATGGAAVPFGDDWSCGIKLGTGEWPGLLAEPLFAADLLPVCAPRLAAQLKRPSDLKAPGLLRVAHSPDDWPMWLKAAGLPRLTARGPEFQYYGHALQAALDGLGVAMGIRPYIDDDLAAGRLVAPFELSVPKGMRWYLVYRSYRAEQRDFTAFRRWIMRAAAAPAPRQNSARVPAGLTPFFENKPANVNSFTFAMTPPCFPCSQELRKWTATMTASKSSPSRPEAGLWHARIWRVDRKSVIIDGVLFSALEVGFAWSDPEAAVGDAKTSNRPSQSQSIRDRRVAVWRTIGGLTTT